MVELIAKRYGTALYELAVETNQVDEISEQLEIVQEILLNETEFFEILNHPKIVIDDKVKMVEEILEDKVNSEVLGLFVITIRKGRQNNLIEIIKHCLNKINDYKGKVVAHVISATELTEGQRSKLKKRLEDLSHKIVILKESVDSSLIGGLTIRIGDRIVDNSITGKLNSMAKELYETQLS